MHWSTRDHSSIIAITKEKDLQENSIQKLLLQLAHNAGDIGFWRKDVYEGLEHVFPLVIHTMRN